jgi:hypothetical protein
MTPTPKRPLEIGERVSAASVFVGDKNTRIWRGTVLEISGDWLSIRRDGQGDNDHCAFHRRQVRRLVKRKRREWWIVESSSTGNLFAYPCRAAAERDCAAMSGERVIRVLESKPRKEKL